MPYVFRRGYWKAARESSPGVISTTALPGVLNGPLAVMSDQAPAPAGAGATLLCVPTLTREMDPLFDKALAASGVGRRAEDLFAVPGRRSGGGTVTGEVMPNSFGMLLFLLTGTDTVTPGGVGAVGVGGVAVNATVLPLAAAAPALTAGQRIYFADANPEYVTVQTGVAAGAANVTITAGGGTGGGVKFAHAANAVIQFGPWSHAFTPNNAAGGVPLFEAEDNIGGHATSLLYPTQMIDSLDITAPIENPTSTLQWSAKIIGAAPAAAGIVGTGAFTLPPEEIPIATGNYATITVPSNASIPGAPYNSIYVPDFKLTYANAAKMLMAATGSPDAYSTIGTTLKITGTATTIFEDYGVFRDYAGAGTATGAVWTGFGLKWTWAVAALQGSAGAIAPSLTITIPSLLLAKANKFTEKNGYIELPIEQWNALDAPNFGNPPIASFTLVNNVAIY